MLIYFCYIIEWKYLFLIKFHSYKDLFFHLNRLFLDVKNYLQISWQEIILL